MTDNERQIRYGLSIIVKYTDEEDLTLLDVSSDTPFLSIHAGDKIWAKGLKPGGFERPPRSYLYDGDLTVKEVRHAIWEFEDQNKPMIHHSIEVVAQDPYEIDE